jgi:hypothetical protein
LLHRDHMPASQEDLKSLLFHLIFLLQLLPTPIRFDCLWFDLFWFVYYQFYLLILECPLNIFLHFQSACFNYLDYVHFITFASRFAIHITLTYFFCLFFIFIAPFSVF